MSRSVWYKKRQDLSYLLDKRDREEPFTNWEEERFEKYHFHRPFEYEIIKKGQHSDAKYKIRRRWASVGKNHILIRPISIGETKQTDILGVDITQYEFWIARNFIRRGPNSWSIKKIDGL